MPFLPVVLLLAWQALSRSASFALGWATALYFGQIPGNKGRMLAVMALLSTGWVVLIVGFVLPLGVGAALDALGMIERNFTVDATTVLGLGAAAVLGPPLIAGIAEFGGFEEGRSVSRWLRRVPVSYPVAASLGVAVLEMVCITPVLLFMRFRRGQRLLSVPLVFQGSDGTKALVDEIGKALDKLGLGPMQNEEITGALGWPLRTMGFATRNLLGSVVHGDPMRLRIDGVEMLAYATNVSIIGKPERAYPVRAAIQKELAFSEASLTWTDASQKLEARLAEVAGSQADGADAGTIDRLEEIQHEIDRESIALDEWNLLYRKRLQIERRAANR
ncbi:MAG: hypothetical protein ABI534_05450 [Chloroflexota bacterium]